MSSNDSTTGRARYRFGDLSLDVGQRRLERDGRPLHLAKLSYELVVALVEAAPNVVTHDQLAARVWQGRIATPETIAQRVKLVRQVLGDDANEPRYIEVVRGQGYRLIPSVEGDAPPSRLRLRHVAFAQLAPRSRLDRPLVGRDAELGLLERARSAAELGDGRIVLVAGEPGIGKTHLAESFAAACERAGATVLIGRCYEEPGSPPYWPWLQALAAAAKQRGEPELAEFLAADAEALGAAESAQSNRSTVTGDVPSRARHFLFHTVASRLAEIAAANPIVIIFDDLHWADEPSLRLLEVVGRSLSAQRMLLVGTYRDAEITRKSPLFGTLGVLSHEAKVERVRLRGLSEPDVGRIVELTLSQPVSPKLIAEIHHQTDGNPFFVTEVARVIAEELATTRGGRLTVRIPDSIRETIGRHLNRLSDAGNELLAVAAVIGRTFEMRQLELLLGTPPLQILALLEEAVSAGIVEQSEQLGRFQFTHALIGETLYEELPLSRRVALHRDVAGTLEQLHGDRLEPYLGQIARHYHGAAHAGDVNKAVNAALAAAKHAERVLADEEAVGYYKLVLELFELDARDRRFDEAAIHLALGRARWRAGASWQVTARIMETAMQRARESGNRECFIDAACDYVYTSVPAITQATVDSFDEALALLELDDPVNRTRLLCRKAVALHALGRHDEAETAGYEAIDTARRGGDARGVCDAISWSLIVLRTRPETLAERTRLGEEVLALTLSLRDQDDLRAPRLAGSNAFSNAAAVSRDAGPFGMTRTLFAHYEAQRWLLLCYQEAGEMQAVKRIAAELRDSVAKRGYLKHDYYLYFAASAEALCALMDGRWADARERIAETYKLGSKTDDDGARGVFSAQMFHLHRELGELRQFKPVLERFLSDGAPSAWLPALALLHAELGDVDGARARLEDSLVGGTAAMRWSELYLTSLGFLAETCVVIGAEPHAPELYDALLPYSGQMVVHPTAVSLGPADRYLGMLAHLARRPAAARNHFDRAWEQCTRAEAQPWLARTAYAYAWFLAETRYEADAGRASALLADARRIAQGYDMRNLLERIEGAAWARLIEQARRPPEIPAPNRRRGGPGLRSV